MEYPRRWPRHPILGLALELLLITTYSFSVLWFFFDGEEWKTFAEMKVTTDGVIAGGIGAVLWIFLAVRFARGLRRSAARGEYLRSNLGIPLLLVSVVFTYVVWLPAVGLALIVLGFILELPRHPTRGELLTAFALLVFISAIVTIGLVRVERSTSGSQLRTVADGVSWTTARLLQVDIDSLEEVEPRTADGRSLAAVLALCATLFSALFIGAVVSWLTNPGRRNEDPDRSELAALTAEVASLRRMIEQQHASNRLPENPLQTEGELRPGGSDSR